MHFWLDVAAFAVKTLLIVLALGALAILFARLSRRGDRGEADIEVRSLNERYERMRDALGAGFLDRKAQRARARTRRREARAARTDDRKRVFVLGFKGDPMASTVGNLAREIDAVLTVARRGVDEVVLRLHSPGGTVTGYGLAAAEITRLRDAGLTVIASVDQVAASGGYMMACAADRIVAAPFALVGSIGVVAQVPNVHRLLKKNDIDFEELTAGEFKRSVSLMGEITPAGREHFRGKIEDTHEAFKAFVAERRPAADLARVANGDAWLAREALGLGLVDALSTGDALLFGLKDEARLFEVAAIARKSPLQQIFGWFGLETLRAPLAAIGRAFRAP